MSRPGTSRVIQVDRLTFRWELAEGPGEERRVVVRHALDDGRLTIPLAHDVSPTDGLVARAVRLARAAGWQTVDHVTVRLEDEAPLEQPDAGSLRADAVTGLGVVPLEADDGADLQVLLTPSGGPPLCLTYRAASATAELVTRANGERKAWRTVADADWVRDGVVQVGSMAPDRREGLRVDALSVAVAARVGGVVREITGDASVDGPARDAALLGWRLALAAFAHRTEPLGALDRLHDALRAPEPPWRVTGRVLRLWGRPGWPQGGRALAQLDDGPWIVDARDLLHAPAPLAEGLRARAARPEAAPVVFVGWAPHGVEPVSDLSSAEARIDAFALALRDRFARGALAPEHVGVAWGDWRRFEEPGPGWLEREPPADLAGFVCLDGPPAWGPDPGRPMLLVRPDGAWIRGPDGRTWNVASPR